MIKKLQIVKNLGIYQDFQWTDLPDFANKNIIYGWNYSGKTTLSRLFSSLRDRKIHKSYSDAEFKIILKDNTEINHHNIGNSNLPILVFNSEYIKENLKWETNESFAGITFDVGENVQIREDIEYYEDLILKISGNEDLKSRKEPHQLILDEFNSFDAYKFSAESKKIKNDIFNSLIDFDKRHFNTIKTQVIDNLEENIISDADELNRIKKIALASYDKEKIDLIDFTLFLNDLHEKSSELLNREPMRENMIEILDGDFGLSNWVSKGIELHESRDDCSFCGQPLTKERVEKLKLYFSNESSNLRADLQFLREEIDEALYSIKFLAIPKSKNDFFDFYQEAYETLRIELDEIRELCNTFLKKLQSKLNDKEEKYIFLSMKNISLDNNVIDKFNGWISRCNEIISKHNYFVENFDSEQEIARILLKKHQVSTYLLEEEYLASEKRKKYAERCISLYDQTLKKFEEKIKTLEAQLKSIIAGKQELNDFINRFLNRNDILIDVVDDDKFILKRGDKIAENLSEGEKTAISFSYFLVVLESLFRDGKLANYVIFIDDPISSLDSNHISQIYSLINSFFFRKTNPNNAEQYVNCFNQLFISTHNFEFFSFIKDSNRINPSSDRAEYYFIKRISHESSKIQTIPKSLKNYKSEYIYLFETIFSFYEEGNHEANSNLILMPNALRRFLEIYTLMKLPHSTDQVDARIKILFPDHGELKTLHHFSHFTTFEKVLKHDELLMNVPQAVQEIISILEKDILHFGSLKKAIGKT